MIGRWLSAASLAGDPAAVADQGRSADRSGSVARRVIRVGLVDDHHLVREGLRLVLGGERDMEVVGEAESLAEAFELQAAMQPDVLLFDLTFPEGDGMSVLRELSSSSPEVRIVVLTMHRDAETVRQALQAGAAGYVVKGAHSSELIEAIRAVARGERYLHSSVTAVVVEDSIRWAQLGSPISPREREIIGLIGAGHSATEAARILGISAHTVRRHVANASQKLGVRGARALTRYAVEHGLIREEG